MKTIFEELQRIDNMTSDEIKAEYSKIDNSDFACLIETEAARELIKKHVMNAAGVNIDSGVVTVGKDDDIFAGIKKLG